MDGFRGGGRPRFPGGDFVNGQVKILRVLLGLFRVPGGAGRIIKHYLHAAASFRQLHDDRARHGLLLAGQVRRYPARRNKATVEKGAFFASVVHEDVIGPHARRHRLPGNHAVSLVVSGKSELRHARLEADSSAQGDAAHIDGVALEIHDADDQGLV